MNTSNKYEFDTMSVGDENFFHLGFFKKGSSLDYRLRLVRTNVGKWAQRKQLKRQFKVSPGPDNTIKIVRIK